jgi:hypothetical protein
MGTGSTQVIVRQTSDRDVREYHVSEPICDVHIARFFQPLWGAENRFSDLGPTGKKIAEKLMEQAPADFIEKVTFRPFSVLIRKNPSASWAKLEPTYVVPALQQGLEEEDLSIQHDVDAEPMKIKVGGRQLSRV